MSKKRGRYLSYLQNEQNGPKRKVPRQTIWNQRNREKKLQSAHDHGQRQLYQPTFTIDTNVNISIVEDDSRNDSIDLVDHTISFEEEVTFATSNEESIIGDDSELNLSEENILNNFSSTFDETVIDTNYDENENNFCVNHFRKIHKSLDCTVMDVYSMIYAYSVRHNSNWAAVEDLIHLVNSIIGENSLPSSKYMFKKMFQPKENFSSNFHFWCHLCEKYLGVKEDFIDDPVCPNCNSQIVTDTKYKKNHFIAMKVKNQLKNVLEQNSEQLIFDTESSSNNMTDVHSSHNFQRLKNEMGNTPYITLTMYTDGAAVFKSTKQKSIWPILVSVNEIGLNDRFKRENILCTALSFGKTPNMQMFFKPFIDEIKTINAEGGITFCDKNGQYKTVQVIPMIFTADALAKAYVLNMTQHNGRYGCPYCLHRGTNVEGSTQIRYCNEDIAPNRTNQKARADMFAAHSSTENVNGYKGVSPLIALGINFDIVWQVVIDKMHNVDMGVIRKLFNLFFNPKYRVERYIYILNVLISKLILV